MRGQLCKLVPSTDTPRAVKSMVSNSFDAEKLIQMTVLECLKNELTEDVSKASDHDLEHGS